MRKILSKRDYLELDSEVAIKQISLSEQCSSFIKTKLIKIDLLLDDHRFNSTGLSTRSSFGFSDHR